ncbi:MAG: hypothetical protein KAT56_06565, partial [Sedimentisphaerales bacterium]|nr:hypothetical protein [Sedimentisphaerales bacterium]
PRLTNMPRSINREKLDLDLLEQQLLDDGSRRAKVFSQYTDMIRKRRAERVFHPLARQTVLDLGDAIFALARTSDDGNEIIIALHNVTCEPISLTIEPELWNKKFGLSLSARAKLTDLISGTTIELDSSDSHYSVQLTPYQFAWLKTTAAKINIESTLKPKGISKVPDTFNSPVGEQYEPKQFKAK